MKGLVGSHTAGQGESQQEKDSACLTHEPFRSSWYALGHRSMGTAPKDQVTKGRVGRARPPVPWRDHAMLSREPADRVIYSWALQVYWGVSEQGGPDTTGCGALANCPLFLAVLC